MAASRPAGAICLTHLCELQCPPQVCGGCSEPVAERINYSKHFSKIWTNESLRIRWKGKSQVVTYFSKLPGPTSPLQPSEICRACGILQVSIPGMLSLLASTPGQRQWNCEHCTSNGRTQIGIVRNIMQQAAINSPFWDSFIKANLSSPGHPPPLHPQPTLTPALIHLGPIGIVLLLKTQVCTKHNKSSWRFHNFPRFFS